ncbi:MAG: tetratricopeptide repeat protein [Phycisphaeraceae bacterium]|nr:tetratricopeptide repeat protein [Phycisphaeraceae bacterium]
MEPALQRAFDLSRTGSLPAAIAAVRKYLAIKPASLEALNLLGLLLTQSGELDLAEAQLRRAVELAPNSPQAHNNLAHILLQRRRFAESARFATRAVEINPGYAFGYLTLSCALASAQDSLGAIEAARRGLSLEPDSPQHTRNLVIALDASGRFDEALRAAEAAHARFPTDAPLHSMLLMFLNYTDRPDIAEVHRRFGELHPASPPPPLSVPDPDRPLRVGFLSSDLRTHSVGFFIDALLSHAPTWVSTHCFSQVAAPKDPMAQRFRAAATTWREVGHVDDATLAAVLREAKLDILVDLMGHTGGNRLPVLAGRPAPIALTAIGYPNTTGFGAIDYRLVDSITDPPGLESLCTESLLRVDPCFLCYRPPDDAPAPSMPAPDQPITFGSFNAPAKIGPRTAALWAGVLQAVPGSRLVLKSKDLSESCARDAVRDRLQAAGVDRDRIEFLPAAATIAEHLALYSRVHLALDTVPYNGTTTTCEALWMGVPVVTLMGDRHAARVGASLLRAVGREAWVADSAEDYVRIAAGLARASDELGRERATLRAEIASTALCDARAYATRVYGALREVWRRRCNGKEK